MNTLKVLVISSDLNICRWWAEDLEEYQYESSYTNSYTEVLTNVKSNYYDVIILFFDHGYGKDDVLDTTDILDTLRCIRTEGFSGALLLMSGSPHSLYDICTSYPLSTIVDAVIDISTILWDPGKFKPYIDYAVERSNDKRLGRQDRSAIWLSDLILAKPHSMGFKFSL